MMNVKNAKTQIGTGKKTILRRAKLGILIFVLLAVILIALDVLPEGSGVWKPDYQKIDLDSILVKAQLSEDDYHALFLQTGLGKAAVDEIFLNNIGIRRERTIEEYQNNFFASGDYECRNVAIFVNEERIRNDDGAPVKGFEIADLKNGDVLITKATHTVGWRHGHAAIVTDATRGETLEAILLGNPSLLQNTSKWQTFPSYIQLRLKEDFKGDAERIAEYAKENFNGIPYGLFTGIPNKAPLEVKKTQCSHLVWYPYMHFGYDIDSDGSWLVTPKDIANSDLFDVVQVFGVNPEEVWP
ncbi:hypothetical protein FRZ06_03640 [Anoxybacterium hadale]|uniref:Uncharacterized protein n=1 Tax=Anoxybacterium hadale TaxID=3408580 RepID=A0ACD1A7W2_9FIRM|nr:hypothetical protein FRZ06_03640 [Clostridiales bacterium]